MANDAVLKPAARPEDYKAPTYKEVVQLLTVLKRQRQPVIDRITEVKKVRRRQWEEVLRIIPKSYRKVLLTADAPQFEHQLRLLAGLVAKHEPVFHVLPPSGRPPEVNRAAKEEARLNAVRMQIADQQDRDPYAMGIDAQIAWGESWLGVWPDARCFKHEGFKRKKDEAPEDYEERVKTLMADGGVPFRIVDYDPQTVFPFRSDQERLVLCIVESQHQPIEIALTYGYRRAGKDPETGKTTDWRKVTLSEPYLAMDQAQGLSGVTDPTHDIGVRSDTPPPESAVHKVEYMDCWVYQLYLDGVLVEQWEHNFGVVPMFCAYGAETSDRDPAYQSSGIMDPIVSIAKQVVLFSAILAANAMQHGFPTPFLRNPEHGLVHPITGQPLKRDVVMGEMNLLGPQEEIIFPYLSAEMMPDFFKYMDYLSGVLEDTSIANLGKAVGTEMAGYAMAQVRAMQMSVLAPVYSNAKRQWRKIGYFIRHLTEQLFPAGYYLRGAVEETEEGVQYRPILKYSKADCTPYTINCDIEEGIKQDEIAERKSAIELGQAGYWSVRRVMEATGVEDPEAEKREIDVDRVLSSPAADEVVLQMAVEMATQRLQASRQDLSSPFYQALEESKREFMGGGGQFQNQGGEPMNALPGGQPMQQNPSPDTPLQGGPTQGPRPREGISHQALGVPGLPGGVRGGNPPAGAPG